MKPSPGTSNALTITVDGITYREVRPRAVSQRPPRDPSLPPLKSVYMDLATPANTWRFEGCLVLPPILMLGDPNRPHAKRRVQFVLGHRTPKLPGVKRPAHPMAIKPIAYEPLAMSILEKFNQGDHVVAEGHFSAYFNPTRRQQTYYQVVTKVKLVKAGAVKVPGGGGGGGEVGVAVDLAADTEAVIAAALR